MTRHLGDVLAELREDQGLSKSELARRSNVALSLISRIESHEHHTMTGDNLARIAQQLGATVDAIRERVDRENNAGHPVNEYPLEEWLARDRNLTDVQRETIQAVYRSYVDRR